MRGLPVITRPTWTISSASASTSRGGRTAPALEQRRLPEREQPGLDLLDPHVGGEQPDVLEDFGGDPAEAGEHHRAPFGIVLGADDHLDAHPAHLFDQHAVERDLRLVVGDVAVHRVEGFAHVVRGLELRITPPASLLWPSAAAWAFITTG